ncbi:MULTISPECIES: hypothetical protein [Kitasatospora]|uniref:Uncharacterized protein n=1 Tax=Kitasatospora cystarginea TaxID=58350 RepID=A0ABP5RRE6_9ACTN
MSQPEQKAVTTSTPVSDATANPRRTTLAAAEGYGDAPQQAVYTTELPASTANPRRTVLMVAPAPRKPLD